jgi:AcrR family transcriptional regulator
MGQQLLPIKHVSFLPGHELFAVFLANGFSAATTDMIQQAAGVSKSTVYSHYPNKEALFAAVELLGEHFLAFRDSEGRVGLLDQNCCHRGASLLLGRVEGCGLRCIYHGWKFAVDGKVLETPNVPDPKFKDRVRARAYPVRESAGLIVMRIPAMLTAHSART